MDKKSLCFILLFILLLFIVIVLFRLRKRPPAVNNRPPREALPPEKEFGLRGERLATSMLKRLLRNDDLLFTNVCISIDGRETELDDVIVNKYGVFILEVKNYRGILFGTEDDEHWTKLHESNGHNIYEKTVDNPIRQVKRQIYLLRKYLDYYDAGVWIEGYVIIIGTKPPVNSDYILLSTSQTDKAIHTPGKQRLSKARIERIADLLRSCYGK